MTISQQLQQIEVLKEVPLEQLQWLVDHSEIKTYEPGEHIFEKDRAADHLIIILSGKVVVYIQRDKSRKQVTDLHANDITGVLPYSRMKTATGYGEVTETSQILFCHRDNFPALIKTQYELTEAFVHKMLNRTRTFTTLRIQDEKLMALGKLSAGLAHELNNPISAINRNAQNLKKHLTYVPGAFKKITKLKLTDEQTDNVNDLIFRRIDAGLQVDIPLLEKTELEDECIDWLEDHNFDDVDEKAELFIEFGISTEDLDCILGEVGEEYIHGVLNWCVNVLSTEKYVIEIQESSQRVASLIASIKEYSYMDRSADRQAINLHPGIRNTVTMLGHKFRKNQVEFVEAFDEQMPQVHALPGELNQVWTNIIDNALDALEGHPNPTLTVKTEHNNSFAKVYIIDNGPGIHEDIQSRIFEPFFTTKEMGKGTGLGLEVVRKIVKQHKGDIRLKSKPGYTEFLVCIPLC